MARRRWRAFHFGAGWNRLIYRHEKRHSLNETDGFDIFHNGVNRTFRDIEQVAIDSAIYGKNAIYGKKVGLKPDSCSMPVDGSLREIMPDLSVKAVQSLV